MTTFFCIGSGTVKDYIDRGIAALNELREKYIYFPGYVETLTIAEEIQSLCGFAKCIGFIDVYMEKTITLGKDVTLLLLKSFVTTVV
ncbi:hypothetical protein AC1031_016558 [Aphanomyces cochlioides]|nr:hypothetical protein AC1031_016558 [Aphanomyces cochlioides]